MINISMHTYIYGYHVKNVSLSMVNMYVHCQQANTIKHVYIIELKTNIHISMLTRFKTVYSKLPV